MRIYVIFVCLRSVEVLEAQWYTLLVILVIFLFRAVMVTQEWKTNEKLRRPVSPSTLVFFVPFAS